MASKQTEPAKVKEEKKSTTAEETKEKAAVKKTTKKKAGSSSQTKRREKPRRPPAAPSTHPMMTRSKTAAMRMQAAVQQRPVVHLKPPGATHWGWRFMQWFQRPANDEVDRTRVRCRLCYQTLKYFNGGSMTYHLQSRHHMRPPQRGH